MRLMLVVTLLLPFGAICQDTPAPKKAPPEPKNLKILTGQSGAEVITTMRAFTTALGVQCNFCHVQGNFASDDNPKKEVARNMLLMTRDINAKFPDGQRHVSCYTCHRGANMPLTAPPEQPK